MPLVNTKGMFKVAYEQGFAVGAFNVNNMELIQGIMEAVAEEKAPLILQLSKGARQYANPRWLTALIQTAAAQYPDIPICMHLDHGDTVELANQCVDEGYGSVMIDKSHDPFDVNAAETKKVVDHAHARKYFCSVEAELGRLGGIEEHVVGVADADINKFLTDPKEVQAFVKASGVDSLAVAIGTSHGAYKFKSEPKLAFDRLEQIRALLPGFPLVLHGASTVIESYVEKINKYGGQMVKAMGVPEEALKKASTMGVCKVNIDTDLRLAMTAEIREVFAKDPKEFDPRKYLGPARKAIKEVVKRKLNVLGCVGKAEACLKASQR
jgi:fructose-bisphosphate aldolase, class II